MSKAKILIVDDEQLQGRILKDLFRDQQHEIKAAFSDQEALEIIDSESSNFGLVIISPARGTIQSALRTVGRRGH